MRAATRLLPKAASISISLSTSQSQNPIRRIVTQPATTTPCRDFFSGTRILRQKDKEDSGAKAKELGQDEQENGFDNQIDNAIGEQRELQARTPWHREGSDRPPFKRDRSAGAMTKGLLVSLL